MLQEFNRMRQHPYPTPKERLRMAQKIGISVEKVNNWFINQVSLPSFLYLYNRNRFCIKLDIVIYREEDFGAQVNMFLS